MSSLRLRPPWRTAPDGGDHLLTRLWLGAWPNGLLPRSCFTATWLRLRLRWTEMSIRNSEELSCRSRISNCELNKPQNERSYSEVFFLSAFFASSANGPQLAAISFSRLWARGERWLV